MSPALEIARKYSECGINLVPIRTDGSKSPAVNEWKHLQQKRNTPDEIIRFFGSGNGIAAIGGKISGNLEDFDFDDAHAFEEWKLLIVEQLGQGYWDRMLIVGTPRPGFAVIVRCPSGVEQSQKLAMALNPNFGETTEPKLLTLIETKGEGGYFLLPGCPLTCHKTGRPYTMVQGSLSKIPEITAVEREVMLSSARSLSQIVRSEQSPQPTLRTRREGELLPGDDFNSRGPDWSALLLPHGFKLYSQRGESSFWTRPDKDSGISASTNHGGHDCFYPFSSNLPFDTERGYRKFAVYTILEHQGNFKAAARALAIQGYGSKNQPLNQQAVPEPLSLAGDEIDVAAATALAHVMHAPTEDNVALLFEQRFANALRYCKTWGFWLWWDGSRWSADRTDRALDFCRELARTVNTTGKSAIARKSFASGVEAFARAARTFATEPDQWDRDVCLLNTPDGVEELEVPHETT